MKSQAVVEEQQATEIRQLGIEPPAQAPLQGRFDAARQTREPERRCQLTVDVAVAAFPLRSVDHLARPRRHDGAHCDRDHSDDC